MSKPKFFLSIPATFSPSGRMSRLQYFVYGIIYAIAVVGIFFAIYGSGTDAIGAADGKVQAWVFAAVMGVFLYFLICLYAKRLHDLGWPAILCAIALFDLPIDIVTTLVSAYVTVPEDILTINEIIGNVGNIIGMGFGIILTFKKGQSGANKYGPDPLRPSQAEASVF
jgi:uncharacterized membrane protein YhaH (DUF805 family)